LQIGNPLSTDNTSGDVSGTTDFSKISYYSNSSLNGIGNSAVFDIETGYSGVDFDGIDSANTYFNFDFTTFGTNSTNTVE